MSVVLYDFLCLFLLTNSFSSVYDYKKILF